jgi:hypothetical protein
MAYSEANNPNPNFQSAATTSLEISSKPADALNGDIPDADAVFKKYGIGKGQSDRFGNEMKTGSNGGSKSTGRQLKPGESRPFGEAVLERFSPAQLAKIDSVLVTGAFVTLSIVVLIGTGMSFGAVKVVFPQYAFDPNVDNVIQNILTPAFTPSLLLFFLASITYGLFKFAQASSSDTIYREE